MYLDSIQKIADEAASNGSRITTFGTQLYGKAVHIAPEAWLHVFHQGLSLEQIRSIEDKLGKRLPVSLASFFTSYNGLSIFSGSMSIFGVRWVGERQGDAAWQPFDIFGPNTFEKPRGTPASQLCIGAYFYDGSRLVVDTESSAVFRVPHRSSAPVLNEWKDFDQMMSMEIQRLSELFDDQGRLIDPQAVTSPG